MLNIKKSLKIITFVFVLVMCFSVISMIDAATFNITGKPVQFGWDYRTPEDGSTISSNTGAAIYYPATIEGQRAFCADYLKAAPNSGASLSQVGTLTTLQTAVIYEGMQRGSTEGIMAATQLAFWKATGGFDFNYINFTTYFKSNVKGVKVKTTLNNMISTAKDIYNSAKQYKSSDFSESSNINISVNTSQVKKTIEGDYAYIGPLEVTTNSGNDITFNIPNNTKALILVGAVGSTTSLSTVPANGIVYLKVPLSAGSGSQKVTFYTKSKVVNGYMYSNNNSKYQRFGIIKESDLSTNKSVTFKWTVEGKIVIKKIDDDTSKVLSGATFTLYDKNKQQISEKTTTSDGIVTFENLQYGTYYIKEKTPPQNYLVINAGYIEIECAGDETITVKNKPMKGRVKITKYVKYDASGEQKKVGQNDATFQIYTTNNVLVDTITTNANGEAISDYLPIGSYYLIESAVNTNYMSINSSEKVNFSITSENYTQIIDLGSFINKGLTGSLEIYKYAIEDNKEIPISGAKFGIYNKASANETDLVGTIVTGGAGKGSIGDLMDGTYWYKELSVPDGYKLDSTLNSFSISASNRTIKKEIENKILVGNLYIEKKDNNGKALKGIEFKLYESDKKTVVSTLTTDNNGKASYKNIKYGTYFIKETKAPEYVIMDSKWKKVIIGEGKDASINYTLKLTNDLIDLGIKLYKVDENDNPISGVKFNLYSDSEGKKIVKTATTDSEGLALFSDLDEGTYYYKEVSAPEGYITTVIAEMQPITISHENLAVHEETIENKTIKGKVKVHKINEDDMPIQGVEFDIKDSNGKVVGSLTTDKNGNAISEDLKKGNYTLVETYVPSGYVLSKEEIPFTVNNDAEIVEVEIENEYNKGKVKVKKVDADTKEFIDGAEFKIYKYKNDGTAQYVDSIVNFNDEGIGESQELKNGKYYIVETKAPEGAILDSTKYDFEITDNEKIFEITVENKIAKGKIKFIKCDNYENPLKGVKFNILAEDKKTIIQKDLVTDDKGEVLSNSIKLGVYYIQETYAPENYVKIDNLIKVEITEDEQIVILKDEIVNTKITSKIKFIKNDEKGAPIQGVKFQILGEDKKTVVKEEIITDANGEATFNVTNKGTYYIKEIYAPDIYIKLTELIKVEIENYDQVVTLKDEIVNQTITGGIKIIKKDDAGTPISNVEFAVYKEGEALPVSTITTNEQGVAICQDLIVGKYYFIETKVPDNLYINSEKVSFEITEIGQLIEKTVVNERVKGKLVINKTNSDNGTGIEGVTFEIYDSNKQLLGRIHTNVDGVATTENLKDDNGNVIPLYAGTYYYVETAAPDRFYFESVQYSFVIAKGSETVNDNVENVPFKIPQTGGFMGTDTMIITIVSIVSIAGYIFGNIMINRKRFA